MEAADGCASRLGRGDDVLRVTQGGAASAEATWQRPGRRALDAVVIATLIQSHGQGSGRWGRRAVDALNGGVGEALYDGHIVTSGSVRR